MKVLRQTATFLALIGAIGAFLIEGVILRGIVLDPGTLRRLRLRRAESYARVVSGFLGLRVVIEHELTHPFRRRLIVCNHLSYVDMLVLYAALPACFVSSEDMRRVPVLGWLCEMGGCLFVERKKKTRAREDIARVAATLREGFDVAVFPEATSTAGDSVLPYRPALFQAAVEAAALVQPLHLAYDDADVAWYGDMTFVPHLWKLSGKREIRARLSVLKPMSALGMDARELCARAHAATASRQGLMPVYLEEAARGPMVLV